MHGSTLKALDWFDGTYTSTDGGANWTSNNNGFSFSPVALALVDRNTSMVVYDGGRIIDTDEASVAASQVSDYGASTKFGSGSTTSTFGVCIQTAVGTLEPG